MTGKKVLVTGASGMLGSVLVRRLSVFNRTLGISASGRAGTLAVALEDASAVRAFMEKEKPVLVIHCAAYSNVDGCETDPERAYRCNVRATKNLVEAAEKIGARFIYISTDYVFDGRKRVPYEADEPTLPVNIYGATKLAGEFYLRRYPHAAAIVRTSWLFGPGNPDNFVQSMLTRLSKEASVSVLDDQENSPTYTEDLAEALVRIADSMTEDGPEATSQRGEVLVYQVCNSGSTTRHAMTLELCRIPGIAEKAKVGRADRSAIVNRLAVRPAYTVMSKRFYEETFKVKMRPWQEALADFIKRSF